MIDFLSTNAGMIGLLFFFLFFCAVSLWTFRPGSKSQYKKFGQIPLEENE